MKNLIYEIKEIILPLQGKGETAIVLRQRPDGRLDVRTTSGEIKQVRGVADVGQHVLIDDGFIKALLAVERVSTYIIA